jgi:hypothetical protein
MIIVFSSRGMRSGEAKMRRKKKRTISGGGIVSAG